MMSYPAPVGYAYSLKSAMGMHANSPRFSRRREIEPGIVVHKYKGVHPCHCQRIDSRDEVVYPETVTDKMDWRW